MINVLYSLLLRSVNPWKRDRNDEVNKIMRMVLFARDFAVFAVLTKHE